MPKLSTISAPGFESECDSRVTPEQQHLRFGDLHRLRERTAKLSQRIASALTELGGLDWAAVALGHRASYASKLSEALHGVDGRKPAVDVLLLVLSQGGEEAREVLALLCDVAGCEAPRAKRMATDAEIVAALSAEAIDSGPIGKALLERIAARLGCDVSSVKR
jgi:hypothetical protein